MEADFLILVLLVASFMLGILRGAVRQLLAFGAWFVTFVIAAYLQVPIGDWLNGQNPALSQPYTEMLGFLLTFILLFGLALAIIEIGGTTVHLTGRPVVDEVVGGFLMLGVGLLVIASISIILDSFYASTPPPTGPQVALVADLYAAFQRSVIVQQMHQSLIPGVLALLSPLLPANVNPGG